MTLLELFALVRKHMRLVIVLPLVAALITAAYAFIVMPNTYTASASMYILAKSGINGENTITQSDLSASQQLTNDAATLIKSSRVQTDAAKALGMEDLRAYRVNVESEMNTRVLTVQVTGTSAAEAAAVANQLAHTVSDVAREVMDVESVNIIDEASEPQRPSGPPRLRYVLIALLAGLFLAVGIVVVLDMANTRIRSAEDASEMLELPVIGRIPVIH